MDMGVMGKRRAEACSTTVMPTRTLGAAMTDAVRNNRSQPCGLFLDGMAATSAGSMNTTWE